MLLVLHLTLPPAQAPQLVPPVKAEFPEPRPSDDDIRRRPDDGDEIERQVYDKFEDLDEGPRCIFGTGGWLAEHLDGIRRVREEQTLGSHEVGEAFVNQSSLRVDESAYH